MRKGSLTQTFSTLGLEGAWKSTEGVELAFFFDQSVRKFTEKTPRPCVNVFNINIKDGHSIFQRVRDAVVSEKLRAAWPGFIGIAILELEGEGMAEFKIFSSDKVDINASFRHMYNQQYFSLTNSAL